MNKDFYFYLVEKDLKVYDYVHPPKYIFWKKSQNSQGKHSEENNCGWVLFLVTN